MGIIVLTEERRRSKQNSGSRRSERQSCRRGCHVYTKANAVRLQFRYGTQPRESKRSGEEVHAHGEQILAPLRARPRSPACHQARGHTTRASAGGYHWHHHSTCIGPTRAARRDRRAGVARSRARLGLARSRRRREGARRCPKGSYNMGKDTAQYYVQCSAD